MERRTFLRAMTGVFGALATGQALSAEQVAKQLETSFPELKRDRLQDLVRQIMIILNRYVRPDGDWTIGDLNRMRQDLAALMREMSDDDDLIDWRLETAVEGERAFIYVSVVLPLPASTIVVKTRVISEDDETAV